MRLRTNSLWPRFKVHDVKEKRNHGFTISRHSINRSDNTRSAEAALSRPCLIRIFLILLSAPSSRWQPCGPPLALLALLVHSFVLLLPYVHMPPLNPPNLPQMPKQRPSISTGGIRMSPRRSRRCNLTRWI